MEKVAEVEELEGKFDIVERRGCMERAEQDGEKSGGQCMGEWNGRFEVVRHGKGLKRRNGEKG